MTRSGAEKGHTPGLKHYLIDTQKMTRTGTEKIYKQAPNNEIAGRKQVK